MQDKEKVRKQFYFSSKIYGKAGKQDYDKEECQLTVTDCNSSRTLVAICSISVRLACMPRSSSCTSASSFSVAVMLSCVFLLLRFAVLMATYNTKLSIHHRQRILYIHTHLSQKTFFINTIHNVQMAPFASSFVKPLPNIVSSICFTRLNKKDNLIH